MRTKTDKTQNPSPLLLGLERLAASPDGSEVRCKARRSWNESHQAQVPERGASVPAPQSELRTSEPRAGRGGVLHRTSSLVHHKVEAAAPGCGKQFDGRRRTSESDPFSFDLEGDERDARRGPGPWSGNMGGDWI